MDPLQHVFPCHQPRPQMSPTGLDKNAMSPDPVSRPQAQASSGAFNFFHGFFDDGMIRNVIPFFRDIPSMQGKVPLIGIVDQDLAPQSVFRINFIVPQQVRQRKGDRPLSSAS
jgi:hypothetical protein